MPTWLGGGGGTRIGVWSKCSAECGPGTQASFLQSATSVEGSRGFSTRLNPGPQREPTPLTRVPPSLLYAQVRILNQCGGREERECFGPGTFGVRRTTTGSGSQLAVRSQEAPALDPDASPSDPPQCDGKCNSGKVVDCHGVRNTSAAARLWATAPPLTLTRRPRAQVCGGKAKLDECGICGGMGKNKASRSRVFLPSSRLLSRARVNRCHRPPGMRRQVLLEQDPRLHGDMWRQRW